MANASIFQQYLQAPRSVADYSADMDKAEGNKLALAAQRLSAQQAQQGMADDQAARSAYTSSAGDPAQYRNALVRAGLYKQVQALDAAALAQGKTKAETQHLDAQTEQQKAAAGKTQQETRYMAATQHAQNVVNVQTPQDVATYIDDGIKQGIFPADKRDAMLQKASSYPTIDAWKQAQVQGAIPVLERMKTDAENSRHAATVAATTRGQDIGASTALAGQKNTADIAAAGRAVTMRGQDITDARTRESNGKAPPGYVWGPAGADGAPTLVAAKGGPADLKMAGALNQDTQALTGSTSAFDRLAVAANEVLNHPGLSGITGKMGSIPNMPGTDASNAEALLGTLKSQVGFGVLQDMRNNSKTGGALGSVSDAEGKRLEANLAALDKSQSLEQFKTNLQKIVTYSQGAKDRLREAYNLKHGQGSTNPSAAPPAAAAPTTGKTVDFSSLK